jgi:hypothetical protein
MFLVAVASVSLIILLANTSSVPMTLSLSMSPFQVSAMGVNYGSTLNPAPKYNTVQTLFTLD